MAVTTTVLQIILATMLAVSAALKLTHRQSVVESYARVGVPERQLNRLAAILLAAAAGLVVGIWWEPLGLVTTGCVTAYFVLAIGAHVRKRQFGTIGTPIVIELVAIAVLVLSAG